MMSLQYLFNEKGQITAVQISIKEWEKLRNKYPDLEQADNELPAWQKEMIDVRLNNIEKNPDRIFPVSSLLDELDKTQL